MGNRILSFILFFSSVLSAAIFFIYRGFGWPFGRESLESVIAFGVFLITLLCFQFYLHKRNRLDVVQQKSVAIGLFVGLLWTMEISMNNILRPGLPGRDLYDDLFWAAIALIIFIISIHYGFTSKKISRAFSVGFWSGLASGAVAGITALIFIVFGMSQILLDPLNKMEWLARGADSGTPNISVYFAYQTLAGAVLHLIVLGAIMGLLLGILGGLVGKLILFIKK